MQSPLKNIFRINLIKKQNGTYLNFQKDKLEILKNLLNSLVLVEISTILLVL